MQMNLFKFNIKYYTKNAIRKTTEKIKILFILALNLVKKLIIFIIFGGFILANDSHKIDMHGKKGYSYGGFGNKNVENFINFKQNDKNSTKVQR